MPIHDWTKVDAGIFHHFHQAWITSLARVLNARLPGSESYALVERVGVHTDALTLQAALRLGFRNDAEDDVRAIALADAPPKVWHTAESERDHYAANCNQVIIRHASTQSSISVVKVLSSGDKSNGKALASVLRKARVCLESGVHLLIIDLFPPSSHDPNGIHGAIWQELEGAEFILPQDTPLTAASYAAGPPDLTFVEAMGVGQRLPDMPVFLRRDWYVQVPLESTYTAAWEGVPAVWRKRIGG